MKSANKCDGSIEASNVLPMLVVLCDYIDDALLRSNQTLSNQKRDDRLLAVLYALKKADLVVRATDERQDVFWAFSHRAYFQMDLRAAGWTEADLMEAEDVPFYRKLRESPDWQHESENLISCVSRTLVQLPMAKQWRDVGTMLMCLAERKIVLHRPGDRGVVFKVTKKGAQNGLGTQGRSMLFRL